MANQIKENILLVDIGNSSLKWAISASNGLSEMQQQTYPENISKAYFINLWQGITVPNSVILSCVAHDVVLHALEQACNELWGLNVQKVSSLDESFALLNAYADRDKLGSDRCCAMLGGVHSVKSAFMVVDAGSAMTVDVVNKENQHLGGYIIPGITMMKDSLGVHTAQVQNESKTKLLPSLSLAGSTSECVNAGIHLSCVALIEAVFEKEIKPLNGHCLLTGSNAANIAKLLSFECIVVPDLVLRGLAAIAASSDPDKH